MGTILSAVTGFVGGIKMYLIVGALSIGLGAYGMHRWGAGQQAIAQVDGAKATVRLVVHQSAINMQIGDIIFPKLAAIQSEETRRQQEIPVHVTPQIDAQYPVPLGFVRVWNDATHGPIPGPAAGGDADPSGVPLSDVASAHSADETTLDECRADLTTWWDWYDKQSAAFNKAMPK